MSNNPTPTESAGVELPEPIIYSLSGTLVGYTADQMRAMYQRGLDARPSDAAVVPDGLVLVPREPTEAMQKAYFASIDKYMDRVQTSAFFGRFDNHKIAYRAMLAAAPSAPAEGGETRPELDWYKAQIETDGRTVPWSDEVAFLRRLADDPALNIEQSAFLRHCADRIFATRIVDVRALCGETPDSVYSPSPAPSDHVSELISADDGYDIARSRHTHAFKDGPHGDLNEQRAADRMLREAVARRESALAHAKTAPEPLAQDKP